MKKKPHAVKRKTEKPTPNTKWLNSLLESKGLTQQELADKSKIHKSSLSKTFHGKRRLTWGEAAKLAPLLSVPIDELLSGFGVKLDTPADGRFIEVSGWLDGELILRGVKDGVGLRGSKNAPCPFPDRDIRVARVQSMGSEFDGLDGALVYYRETRSAIRGADMDALGKLGVVKVAGETQWRLRVLRRGYASGKFNLTSLSGKMMEESAVVEAVHPVVWLKI